MTGYGVGRNDPCPCGSGKKYKYCCLRKDQRRRRGGTEVSASGASQKRSVGGLLEQAEFPTRQVGGGRGEEARASQEQGEWLERMAAELIAEQQIDAAMEMLEERRDAFDEMVADPIKMMDRAMGLFSGDLFSDFRISPDALQQAFDAVGYPRSGGQGFSDEDIEILAAIAIHLAGDEEARADAARSLLALLPGLVDAGRLKDGWLVQHSAYCLVEVPEWNSPLMSVMVQLAYAAWQQDMQEKRESMLAELGVDVSALRTADPDEIRALRLDVERDPEKLARAERFYAEHPTLQASAERWMMQVGSEVLKLLKRDEAQGLLLSPQEMEPYLSDFVERMEAMQERFGNPYGAGGSADSEMLQAARASIRVVAREMTASIFSSERVNKLIEAMKEYAHGLDCRGDDDEARWVRKALAIVELDMDLSENPVLLAISYGSVREALGPPPGEATGSRDA